MRRLGVRQGWRWRRDLMWMIGLLILPVLFFAPVVVGNRTLLPADTLYTFAPYRAAADTMGVTEVQNPLLADLILQNYPWKRFLVTSLQERSLPLWDPYLFAGHPFLANGQHSALYPLTWLFFTLPIPRAFGVFMALQLGIAGLSMYGLARTIGARRHGAFLAGVTFQFSGFLIASVVHPMIVAAASWLPLLLALVDLTVRRERFFAQPRAMAPWALFGAVVLGLQILAGHAEATYFSLLVIGAFGAWRLAYRLWRYPREQWRAEVVRPALLLILMVGLGLALGAIQLIPLYEVVRGSFRQGAVALSDVLGWAYPKRRIITFLAPNFFGNPTHDTLYNFFAGERLVATVNAHGDPISSFDWGIKNYVEGAAYVGVLPLLLAVIAVLRPFLAARKRTLRGALGAWLRHPYVPFFTLLSLFSLGCIFGTPLYAVIYALPFFDQSHSPFRWVFPLTAALAALAGLGATMVAEFRETHGPDGEDGSCAPAPRGLGRWFFFGTAPNLISAIGVGAIWAGLAMLVGLWGARLAFDWIEPLVASAFWSLARASHAFPDHRAWFAYLFPWLQTAGIFLLSGGIVLRVSRCPIYLPHVPRRRGRIRGRPIWELLAVIVLIVDLFLFGAGFNPAVDPALLTYTPPVVEFLAQDESVWRFSTFDPHGRGTFTANVGMFYDFQDVRGYDSLFAARYARYMGWIEPQGQLPYNRIAPFTEFSSLDSPLTDLLNVKYIITEEEIPLPKYDLVYEDASVRVYENLGVAPRAFTLPADATLPVADVEAVAEAVQRYDPRFYAIIEEDAAAWIGPAPHTTSRPLAPEPGTPRAQAISHYGRNEVLVEATVDEPSWLILADTYFPGWKVFVQPAGAEAETEAAMARIAGNFRGVQLDEGRATVRFKYSPDTVKVGGFVSFLAGMVVIFLAVVWTWRLIYRDREEQTTAQRLAKNSLAPIALNLFNRLVEFAFAALMLRILGPANAGDYYYAINTYIWFDIITNFGLNTYLTREVARHREQARRYLLNTTALRLGLSLLVLPLLAGFIGARQTLVAALTAPASRQALVALGLLYVGLVPTSIATGLTALFYAFEKAEYPAVITTVSTLLKVGLATLVLLAGLGIAGLAGASIIVNVVTLALLGILAWRQFPELRGEERRFRPRAASEQTLRREMVRESWPLMVNHLLATLFFKIDVSLMEAILGSAVLGLYSIGYKFLDALNIIPSMFTLALFPVISRHAQEDRARFVRFYRLGSKILITLALPTAVLTTVAAREMVLVLGGPEYLPGGMIALQWMAWSMPIGWLNSLTQYVLIALDRQRYLTRAYLFAFGFTLVANLWLMPRFGYQASAALHIASELMLLIPFVWGVRQELGRVDWWHIVGKPALATLAMGVVGAALWPVGRWAALIGAAAIYVVVAWRLKLLSAEERALLSPAWRRK